MLSKYYFDLPTTLGSRDYRLFLPMSNLRLKEVAYLIQGINLAVSLMLLTSHEAGCSSPGGCKQGHVWEHLAYCLARRRCSGNTSDSLLKNIRTLCLILSQIYSSQILVLHPSLEPRKVLLPFFSFQSRGCEAPS